MPRPSLIPLVLALSAPFLCSMAASAAEPSPWLEINSSHFTVITDAGEKKGREVALRFEQMRAVFGALLGKERLNQSIPLTILAFKNDKSYYQVAPLAHVQAQGRLQAQPIERPRIFSSRRGSGLHRAESFEEESWRAVAHDFAAMLLNYNYPPAQGWFDEGLAEYFSSIRVDNKQVELGADPELLPSSTQDLLGNQHDTHPAKSLTELLGAQVWLSIPDLFTMKHDTSPRNAGTHHTLYYAESWIVMHYLLHEQKLPETGAYFNLVLNQHVPVEEAIQKAYGMSSAQFEQAVKDYFHAQSPLLMRSTPPGQRIRKLLQRRISPPGRLTDSPFPSVPTTQPLPRSHFPWPTPALCMPRYRSASPNAARPASKHCTNWRRRLP